MHSFLASLQSCAMGAVMGVGGCNAERREDTGSDHVPQTPRISFGSTYEEPRAAINNGTSQADNTQQKVHKNRKMQN